MNTSLGVRITVKGRHVSIILISDLKKTNPERLCPPSTNPHARTEWLWLILVIGGPACLICAYCSSQPSMVHWLSSSIFPCSFVCCRCPAMVTSDQIFLFFNKYKHRSLILAQYHLIPSSTKVYWPSTTKYQPAPPHSDPVPPSIN